MTKYVVTSSHHAHIGPVGTIIELDGKAHGATAHAAYLKEAGKDASTTKPAVVSVGSKEKQ
jgi:ribosomal protein S4E